MEIVETDILPGTLCFESYTCEALTGHLDPSDAPCYVTVTICARCVAVCYTRVSAEESARGTRECACRAQQHPASCPKTDARAGSAQLG